ncbi:oxidoreductase [Ochrobactrum sp. CM-21-5]|nr:oxidoreductase [Ochrobactrum sp. CM-21-5]MBC2886456.1 oxidoreductase [Ochrobactrum sp. CM-21-5]
MSCIRFLLCICFLAVVFSGAWAGSLALPEDKPILVVSGKIENTNVRGIAEFDRAMLEAIGLEMVETATPWYDGRVRFEGVSLNKLMKIVGAKGTNITAVALNDYVTTIPLSDVEEFKVILALKRDGSYMTVRDKGPLFIIYPYDSDPRLQSQTYYTRSAWQVAKLIVE